MLLLVNQIHEKTLLRVQTVKILKAYAGYL